MASEVNPSSLCLYPVLGWGSDTCAPDPTFSGNRALATVSCTFCRPHPPEVHRAQQFFLPIFYLSEIELSLQCCAHFVDLIFQKRSGPDSFLLCLCEIEIATVLCTFR